MGDEEGQTQQSLSVDILTIPCTKCNNICAADSKFCNICGAKLMQAENDEIASAAPPSMDNNDINPPLHPVVNGSDLNVNASGIDEGAVPIQVIQIDPNSMEGRAQPICGVANCDQIVFNQCSVCSVNVCSNHCRIG